MTDRDAELEPSASDANAPEHAPGTPEPELGAPDPEPEPARDPEHAPEPPHRPMGLLTFTIEGRRAPGLFLVGWLATIVGGSTAFVGLLAGGGVGGAVLFVAGLALLAIGLISAAGTQVVERVAAGGLAYAGPSPILVFVASIAATVVLVVAVGNPLVAFGMDPIGPPAAFVSQVLTFLVYVALLRLLVVGPGALSWRELGLTRVSAESLRDLAWGAILAVPILTLTALFAAALSTILPIPPSPLPPAPDAAGLAINLLTAAVLAAIGEELVFRGFATTAWARLDGPRSALVRGSVFFALVHVLFLGAGSPEEGLGLAAFAFAVRLPVAFALGWLFLRRGTLWAPIGLHAVFNGLQVIAAASLG